MEPPIIILCVVIAFFLVAIIKNALNPPRNIEFGELPEVVQSELKTHLPEFAAESVRFSPVVRKYDLKGSYKGNQVRIEAEMTKAGALDELELKDMERYSSISGAAIRKVEEIPESILNMAFTIMGGNDTTPEFVKACHATFSKEPGYKLELRQSGYSYEFEITESGRLLEFEKERHQ